MAFSYSDNLGRPLDQVRFLIRDTVSSTALLSDGEINWTLRTEANVYMAAAMCADHIAAKFKGQSKRKIGELEISFSSKEWESVAKKLRTRGSGHMRISAGGIEVADRKDIRQDDSLLKPDFFSDLHEDTTAISPSNVTRDEELQS